MELATRSRSAQIAIRCFKECEREAQSRSRLEWHTIMSLALITNPTLGGKRFLTLLKKRIRKNCKKKWRRPRQRFSVVYRAWLDPTEQKLRSLHFARPPIPFFP